MAYSGFDHRKGECLNLLSASDYTDKSPKGKKLLYNHRFSKNHFGEAAEHLCFFLSTKQLFSFEKTTL